ncbi:unnamed protein product [Nesidiocoris tenuis]|uniref:Uncharacterized protein n=1 Tax=Nesidiocoris tenuis TaxID=355587 RepID=A0A6H5H4C8_9HEMI|nr:unnamed protein product [Nesidiocoris tenuis]
MRRLRIGTQAQPPRRTRGDTRGGGAVGVQWGSFWAGTGGPYSTERASRPHSSRWLTLGREPGSPASTCRWRRLRRLCFAVGGGSKRAGSPANTGPSPSGLGRATKRGYAPTGIGLGGGISEGGIGRDSGNSWLRV